MLPAPPAVAAASDGVVYRRLRFAGHRELARNRIRLKA